MVNKKIQNIKKKITLLLKKKGIKRAGIFGSYARGEEKKGSDIDLLIEPPKNIGFELIKIELELEKATGKKIDLITYNSLSPYLKKEILSEEIKII